MSILSRRSFVAGCLALSSSLGLGQRTLSLRRRIPKADPEKYRGVQDARDWKNPYLIVRVDGIEIVGKTSDKRAVPVDSVAGLLDRLPDSAWPYGLVVAVQESGVGPIAVASQFEINRRKLLGVLNKLGVIVRLWPSA